MTLKLYTDQWGIQNNSYIQTHSSSWSLLAGPDLIQLDIGPFTSKEGQWLTLPKVLAILFYNDIDAFIKICEQDKSPI